MFFRHHNGLFAICRTQHFVSVLFQQLCQREHDGTGVVDYQNTGPCVWNTLFTAPFFYRTFIAPEYLAEIKFVHFPKITASDNSTLDYKPLYRNPGFLKADHISPILWLCYDIGYCFYSIFTKHDHE